MHAAECRPMILKPSRGACTLSAALRVLHWHVRQAEPCPTLMGQPYRRQKAHSRLVLGLKASSRSMAGKARTWVLITALGQSPRHSGSNTA